MRTALAGAFIGLLSLLLPILLHSQPDSSLTIQTVEGLIATTPDTVVAREIRSRGVNFFVTPKVLETLRQKPADRETLKALAALLVDTTLSIHADPPDCDVVVDNSSHYRTDAAGHLTIKDLEPGG